MRIPLITFAAVSLFTLAACSTPLQRCISDAQNEQAELSAKIEIAQENIDRGYAVFKKPVPYTYAGICYDNGGASFSCEKTGTRTDETPVAIDVAEERAKLARLKRQLISANVRADAEIAQCRVAFAE